MSQTQIVLKFEFQEEYFCISFLNNMLYSSHSSNLNMSASPALQKEK